MVCAPVRSIIPSLKLGDYLSVQAHKPCSISHLTVHDFQKSIDFVKHELRVLYKHMILTKTMQYKMYVISILIEFNIVLSFDASIHNDNSFGF